MWSTVSKVIHDVLDWFSVLWDVVRQWVVQAAFAVYDSLLDLFESVIAAIPVPAAWSSGANFWDSLPGQALYILGEIKIPLVIGIIAGAYAVRFAMNLIPGLFTRV